MSRADISVDKHLAWRMALIAALSTNVGTGLLFGTFGVLLVPVEHHLHVDRSISVLGVPLVLIGNAILSPFAGSLIDRFGIRALMILGAVVTAIGYFMLSLATTIQLNLLAYALFLAPGLVLLCTVVPSALVTQWFARKRGRALGIVNTHFAIILTPLMAAALLTVGGLSLVYHAMTLVALLLVPFLWFIREPPIAPAPKSSEASGAIQDRANHRLDNRFGFLRSLLYWALCIPAAALGCGSTMLATHIVPMALNWGLGSTIAPAMVSVMSAAGIAGSYSFGWLADNIGGARAMSVNCVLQAIMWGLLLTQPPVAPMMVILGLIGMCGSGMIAPFCAALSEHFGAPKFARTLGMSNIINLPLIAVGTPLAGYIFVHTGSYSGALILQICLFVVGAILAFFAGTAGKTEIE